MDIKDESVVSKDGIPLCCCFSKKEKGKDTFVMVPLFAIDENGEAISLRSKKKHITPTDSVVSKYKDSLENCLKNEKKSSTHHCLEIRVGDYMGLVGDTHILTPVSYDVLKKNNE
jgi:hypothetical protein